MASIKDIRPNEGSRYVLTPTNRSILDPHLMLIYDVRTDSGECYVSLLNVAFTQRTKAIFEINMTVLAPVTNN